MFRDMRLCALEECEGVYLPSYVESLEKEPAYWREVIAGDDRAIFGLFDGQRHIGIGSVFTSRNDPSGQTGILAMGYILPEYRGQGLSRLLYHARIEWVLGHSCFKKLEISHRVGNEASRRAILKHGFQLVGQDKVVFGDGMEDWDLCYERVL